MIVNFFFVDLKLGKEEKYQYDDLTFMYLFSKQTK